MKPPFKMIIETEMEKYRYETFWTKEPETIEWIKSFHDGDVFCDVGANIGVYSLYCAAMHPKCRIHAFEPDEKNYTRLVENITDNSFADNITAYPWLIAERFGFKNFKPISAEIGSSGGQMRGRTGKIQCVPLDMFFRPALCPAPNHVKIDIDGQEKKVVQGMRKSLKDARLKSVLVEVNEDKPYIVSAFTDNGFTIANRFNKMKNHSRVRRAREGIKAENVIFTRR